MEILLTDLDGEETYIELPYTEEKSIKDVLTEKLESKGKKTELFYLEGSGLEYKMVPNDIFYLCKEFHITYGDFIMSKNYLMRNEIDKGNVTRVKLLYNVMGSSAEYINMAADSLNVEIFDILYDRNMSKDNFQCEETIHNLIYSDRNYEGEKLMKKIYILGKIIIREADAAHEKVFNPNLRYFIKDKIIDLIKKVLDSVWDNLNSGVPFEILLKNNNTSIAEYFLEKLIDDPKNNFITDNATGQNILHSIVKYGQAPLLTTAVEHLKELTLKPDIYGNLPIHTAFRNYDEEKVRILSEASPQTMEIENIRGVRPSQEVMLCGNDKIILKILAKHIKDYKFLDNDGNTALQVACKIGHRYSLFILDKLFPRMILNKNNDGDTALHLSLNNRAIARYIFDNVEDSIYIKNNKGESCIGKLMELGWIDFNDIIG